jgi:hypothetical protein
MSRRAWRPSVALAALLLLIGAAALVPAPGIEAPAPAGPAYLLLSPNVDEHLDLAEARRRLGSAEHAHFRRLASHILDTLGAGRHQVHDALGEWQGGAENSLLILLDEPAERGALSCAAAWFGLIAQQKTVLAFHAEPGGPDALLTVEMPGRSLEEMRGLLDRHGLRDRTLLPDEGKWQAVVLAPSGRTAGLAEEPGVRLRALRGRGVLLGEPTRAGASERYREVIRAYQARHRPLALLGR